MTDPKEMPARELKWHRRQARKAPVALWRQLGEEQGREDAIDCFATLSMSDPAITHELQRERMANRMRRFRTGQLSDDRIAAWLDAHTVSFARHWSELIMRSGPKIGWLPANLLKAITSTSVVTTY